MRAQDLTRQACCRPLWLVWLLLSLPVAGQVLADSERGAFMVTEANTSRGETAWRLDAMIAIRLSEGAREALENGISLILEFQVQALEKQPWLWKSVVAEQQRRRQLHYHALSRTYLVKDLDTGFQRSFRYLEAALQYAGVLEDVEVLEYQSMNSGRQYTVRVRGSLDIESLPTPVRLLAYVSSAWDMDSEWQQWQLAH